MVEVKFNSIEKSNISTHQVVGWAMPHQPSLRYLSILKDSSLG